MLINKLQEKQKVEQLSDRKFAQRLGISRRLWGMTRDGRTGIGVVILRATTRTYPDLDCYVLEYLRDGHND